MNAALARGFWPEILLGLALSVASAALFSALRPWLGSADALRVILLACSVGYSVWLLAAAEAKVGRLVSVAGLAALSLALLLWNPGLWAWLIGLVTFVWLLRSLYRHDSLVAATTDAGLCMIALAAGVASVQHNHSLWLGLWCYFLIQALHHAIPKGWGARPATNASSPQAQPFEQAYRASEAAFSRLIARH